MGWSDQFISSLDVSSITVRYRLTFLDILNSVGTSFDIFDDMGAVQIARGSIRIQGTRITPQRWSVTFGGFSLQLSGDIRNILPSMRRGQLAALSASVNGSDFEILSIGSLDTLSGQRGLYNCSFKDLLSTLQSSLDARVGTLNSNTDRARFSLFYNVGRTTTTTHGFTTSDTTLLIADGSFFLKSGSKGIARITGGSEDFYVFWTGTTSTSLTGVTAANYDNKSQSGTAPLNSTVTYCAWLEGQPYEILASILTSTGTGNNGAFDLYPQEWGIGGAVDKQIFDLSDSKRASKEIVTSNNTVYDLGIAVEAPLQNGLREIVNIFSTVGIFPVYRHNAVSIRACTDPEGKQTSKTPDIRANINDLDIIDIIQHDFFSTDIPNVYRKSKVIYNYTNSYFSGGTYNNSLIDSLPALAEIVRDFSKYYLASPDNRQIQGLQDLRRLRVWDLFISERLVVRLPLRFAGIVAGDIVTFISSFVEHLYDNPSPIFKGRYCMVLGNDYSLDDQSCVMTLGITSPKMVEGQDQEGTDQADPWEPSDDFNNNQLLIWLKQDAGLVLDDDNKVITWTDQSNNYNFAVRAGENNDYQGAGVSEAQRPFVGTHLDANVITFGASNHQFLAATYRSKFDLSSSDGMCFAAVMKINGTTADGPVGDLDYNGANYTRCPILNVGRSYQIDILHSNSGSQYDNAMAFQNGNNLKTVDEVFTRTTYRIVLYNVASVGGYTDETGFYVNGSKVSTLTAVPTNMDISSSPHMRLGRDSDIAYSNQVQQYNFAFGSMNVKEILLFGIPLHDDEREKVEGYLAHKYDMTSVLPSSHTYKTTVPT